MSRELWCVFQVTEVWPQQAGRKTKSRSLKDTLQYSSKSFPVPRAVFDFGSLSDNSDSRAEEKAEFLLPGTYDVFTTFP